MMRRVLQRAQVARTMMTRGLTDARTVRPPNPHDQIIASENMHFVEALLKQYEQDPALVDASWAPVLKAIQSGDLEKPVVATFTRPTDPRSLSEKERLDNMRLSWMIREYERRGHHIAATNPIPGYQTDNNQLDSSALDPEKFGFTQDDLKRVFNVTFGCNYEASFVSGGTAMTLEQILEQLRRMFCGPIGFEFMSSGYFDLRNWFRQEILNSLQPLSTTKKMAIYEDVVKACGFERFLQVKYATQQRFGMDGGEAFIAAMNAAITESAENGVTSCIVGMAHRGRLNFLANVCQKSLHAILSEFEGKAARSDALRSGDVKYHLGLRKEVKLPNGMAVDIDLLPNPSHLEAVNPLVLGKARARQVLTKDVEGTKTIPILIHGDAAFSGQGSCYETMGFCDLDNFHVGGTLHVVINNQIGFTADPWDTRASAYCTDLSQVNNSPVLHVNGDDVEACVRAAQIAVRFRQQFHRDIIIDLVCYRRNGHNEVDLPDFTQPQLYEKIRQLRPLVDIYTKQLVEESVLTEEVAKMKEKEWEGVLRQAFDRAQSSEDFVKVQPRFDPDSESTAPDLEHAKLTNSPTELPPAIDSGVDLETLKRVGIHLSTIPKAMQKASPVVERTYAARRKGIEQGNGVEWCLGELLAFGTLSLAGIPVRLTGEDVERGTFTQRHAGITDMNTNLKYFPVQTLSDEQALVTIANSSLSEMGVCGFEMGYSMENTKSIIMWEAQFGDFANGAQVIFDQFLSCSEEKWSEQSSLMLSLPHGYSGAGPEHSSARIERFLQLCDDVDHVPSNFRSLPNDQILEARIKRYNWQVTYPSTPANYFHIIRRQGLRDFAKPLINFFSKARLRAPNLSSLDDMATGTRFLSVIDTAASQVVVPRKLVFCSGQIQSIAEEARVKMQEKEPGAHNDVVLVTLEQLAPFPWEQVADVLEKYVTRNPNVEVVWMQEEPKNMGMWAFMRVRFNSLMRHLGLSRRSVQYVGRPAAASPSTGYGSVHVEEEKELIAACFQ